MNTTTPYEKALKVLEETGAAGVITANIAVTGVGLLRIGQRSATQAQSLPD